MTHRLIQPYCQPGIRPVLPEHLVVRKLYMPFKKARPTTHCTLLAFESVAAFAGPHRLAITSPSGSFNPAVVEQDCANVRTHQAEVAQRGPSIGLFSSASMPIGKQQAIDAR